MSSSASSLPTSLHLVTPCVLSETMSHRVGYKVYLKLENLQPSGSFKLRGIGNLCLKAKEKGSTSYVSSSGGNAGLAAAYSAKKLALPITVVIPETTPTTIADNLKQLGANVEVLGKTFDAANERAKEIARNDEAVHIHPFDHPDIWAGHSSLIVECRKQLESKPDVIVLSVGGGGLLNGVCEGLKEVGWDKVPIIAMETKGADCFNKAIEKGEVITLPEITSVAKCLGALTVCKKAFENSKTFAIHSEVVDDKDAVEACLNFADDERFLVEPACGAALAAVYNDIIPKLQKQKKLGEIKSALVIVCGGKLVSLNALNEWKKQFNL
ncbi:uncharacterized protein LOC115216536 [Argonauta hians]